MKDKKNFIILGVAIFIFILAIVFFIWSSNFKNSNNEIGNYTIDTNEISQTKDLNANEYIDFTFYKEDGAELKLSDYKDKATMILFWNTDNEDSKIVLKKVNDMYEKYKEKINFLMINTAQEVDNNIKGEVSFEIYYDFYKEGKRKYGITEEPSMIYITSDNEILNAKSGVTSSDALEANLDILSNNF